MSLFSSIAGLASVEYPGSASGGRAAPPHTEDPDGQSTCKALSLDVTADVHATDRRVSFIDICICLETIYFLFRSPGSSIPVLAALYGSRRELTATGADLPLANTLSLYA